VSADPARAALDARVLAWLREPEWREDEARFEALALALFEFQFEHCAPYRRLCERRGRTPARVRAWREIPAVPTGAFKELALRAFPAEREAHVFRTSGTTTAERGELHLDTLALYEASLLPTFERHVLPDLAPGARLPILALAPARAEAPDSSLSHMFDVVLRARGAEDSRFELDPRRAADWLASAHEPVALVGTAFAFVHLLDALACELALPAGSRIMETGGFKGRAREVSRADLHGALATRLGVARERILNQYGMTELASQFYDSTLRFPGRRRRKLGPPWARVRILDAEGRDAREGEPGAVAVVDLANTGSVLAVQTADLGRRLGDGFEVLGREPGAEARGCSIAADEMLARTAP
jgi:hypothetical protein